MHRPVVVGQAVANGLPRLAVVSRHIDMDVKVVAAMAVEGRISRAFSMARSHHASYVSSLGYTLHFFRNVLPVLAAVAAHMQIAIVSAYPQQVRVGRRLVNGSDRRPCLHAVM